MISKLLAFASPQMPALSPDGNSDGERVIGARPGYLIVREVMDGPESVGVLDRLSYPWLKSGRQ